MNRNPIGIIIILAILIVGGWYLLSRVPASAPATSPTTETTTVPSNTTVTYTDQGFSPKSITVPLGTSVTFVNQSSGNMWVASAAHPSHAAYGGSDASEHCPDTANVAFDECAAVPSGGSYSFTFNKAGDWKYHNHLNASDYGEVVVTAGASL